MQFDTGLVFQGHPGREGPPGEKGLQVSDFTSKAVWTANLSKM